MAWDAPFLCQDKLKRTPTMLAYEGLPGAELGRSDAAPLQQAAECGECRGDVIEEFGLERVFRGVLARV